jgi:hypothetical protein
MCHIWRRNPLKGCGKKLRFWVLVCRNLKKTAILDIRFQSPWQIQDTPALPPVRSVAQIVMYDGNIAPRFIGGYHITINHGDCLSFAT